MGPLPVKEPILIVAFVGIIAAAPLRLSRPDEPLMAPLNVVSALIRRVPPVAFIWIAGLAVPPAALLISKVPASRIIVVKELNRELVFCVEIVVLVIVRFPLQVVF